MEFKPMPKTPRLSREVVITEKIDGTNASVAIVPYDQVEVPWTVAATAFAPELGLYIFAGSRTRWVTPKDDNFGFAAWVRDHAGELLQLGHGHHFGEWWGKGIQRGYGLEERRFSLFNVGRWAANNTCVLDGQERVPECCDVVPVLYRGPFCTSNMNVVLKALQIQGSYAAPGFMDPEGIMVYHTAANQLFKKTLKGDEEGKHAEAHPKKERPPKAPRDPSKGGRRKEQLPFEGPDRRKPMKQERNK